MVGVIKIKSSLCSFWIELYLNKLLINGMSPNKGTLLTFSSSVSNIIPPISKVSPSLTLTLVFVSLFETIGRLFSPVYPMIAYTEVLIASEIAL